MNKKKCFVLRYDPELQYKIDEISIIFHPGGSKNKGIIHAIELAYEIVRQASLLKENKDLREIRFYVQQKYGL